MPKKVFIADLKVSRVKNNGMLYCRLVDAENGETCISADLQYIMNAIKTPERNYELIDGDDTLHKIANNFSFYPKD